MEKGPSGLELHDDVMPSFLPMARSRAWKTIAAAHRLICPQGPPSVARLLFLAQRLSYLGNPFVVEPESFSLARGCVEL